MKRSEVYFTLLFVLISLFVFSQKQKSIDSLEKLLDGAKVDTTQLFILDLLAEKYTKSSPDKALDYCQKALKIADFLIQAKQVENAGGLTILKKRAKKSRGNVLFTMGRVFTTKNKYDEAISYYNESLKDLKEIEDLKGISYIYNSLGTVYKEKGENEPALKMYRQSLEMKKSLGDIKGMANSLNNMGMVYESMGNFAEALDMQLKSLKLKKDINDIEGMASSYMNMAKIYTKQKNYDEALRTELLALELMEKTDSKLGQLRVFNDIGVIYKNKNDFTMATNYYLKALRIAEKIENKSGVAGIFINLGIIEIKKKKYNEARAYLTKSLKISSEIDFKEGVMASYAGIGEADLEDGRFPEALVNYENSLKTAKLINDLNAIQECNTAIAKVYSSMGNYKKAYENHILSSKIKDSIINIESSKQINELKASYENERKEKEIALLTKDKALANAEFDQKIKRQSIIRNFLIFGFILVIVFTFVTIRNYNQKIKSNQIIAKKTEEINVQKANIKGQEEERIRIARELHDGIGGSLAAIKLKLIKIQSKSESNIDLLPVIDQVGDACKEIRNVSHNLAAPVIHEKGFVEALESVIEKFQASEKLNISFDYFEPEELNKVPTQIQSEVYRLIQELLSNIVKHAHASMVEIDLSKQSNFLYLLVEDNGIGFDTTLTYNGIGLRNIKERIDVLRGELIIDSMVNRGTAFNISIPIATSLQ